MATWIRRLVSKNKRRFQDGPHGFDLDLAYIAPRIIAMGLPAEGKDVLYRNPLSEIARFLATYHQGHAKVYNLCSEHRYSADKLQGVLLQQFPFDDHQVWRGAGRHTARNVPSCKLHVVPFIRFCTGLGLVLLRLNRL
eukprot:GHRQ01019112.1.p1 GENE.GHRQ01019112.1~~GHRQ01019112.1.p1  ORF type:complete len:138 (+),score=27.22 GHRQ01019112.1:225-638(+)